MASVQNSGAGRGRGNNPPGGRQPPHNGHYNDKVEIVASISKDHGKLLKYAGVGERYGLCLTCLEPKPSSHRQRWLHCDNCIYHGSGHKGSICPNLRPMNDQFWLTRTGVSRNVIYGLSNDGPVHDEERRARNRALRHRRAGLYPSNAHPADAGPFSNHYQPPQFGQAGPSQNYYQPPQFGQAGDFSTHQYQPPNYGQAGAFSNAYQSSNFGQTGNASPNSYHGIPPHGHAFGNSMAQSMRAQPSIFGNYGRHNSQMPTAHDHASRATPVFGSSSFTVPPTLRLDQATTAIEAADGITIKEEPPVEQPPMAQDATARSAEQVSEPASDDPVIKQEEVEPATQLEDPPATAAPQEVGSRMSALETQIQQAAASLSGNRTSENANQLARLVGEYHALTLSEETLRGDDDQLLDAKVLGSLSSG